MESLCFWSPPTLLGMPAPPIAGIGLDVRASQSHHHHHQAHVSAVGRSASGAAVEASTAPAGARRSYMFPRPVLRLWPGKDVDGGGGGGGGEEESVARAPLEEEQRAMGQREEEDEEEEQGTAPSEEGRDNWVLKILRVRSILNAEDRKPGAARDGTAEERWSSEKEDGDRILEGEDRCVGCCDAEGTKGLPVGDEEDEAAAKIDKDTFLGLLRRVSLADMRLFGQLTYLGSLAYNVPKIKPSNLLKYHSLRFITSSVETKSKLTTAEQVHPAAPHREPPQEESAAETGEKSEQQQKNGPMTSAAAAYQIAATAASHTLNMLPFGSARTESGAGGKEDENLGGSEVTSFMATTNSVTAVVAAKEETKQAVAEDLNSARSSPCEWFICDDDSSGTRFYVIQGSESLASWKANLLFEPVQFEGLDVLVHRGIYEAAKGIYDRMLPEVRDHLRARGDSAAFRFTGHSLGGSLSLLVSLMLLIRGEVPASSLLPVVMFGAPSVMCGGNSLLRRLGLPLSHVQAVTMHRDIVPRAFSCNYPDHVAEILKAVNGNFRNLPCLKHRKLLYAPMGDFLILQPEAKFSPHHHLLPAGAGLYMLGHGSSSSAAAGSARLLRAAQTLFLNSPHPLEVLSDRAAYGAEGTVYRDHDVNAYLRSVSGVIQQELQRAKKAKMERRRRTWWPLVAAAPGWTETDDAGVVPAGSGRGAGQWRGTGRRPLGGFPGVLLQGGRQSLLRRLASSRCVHMLVVLLLPAKLLLLGALRIVSFG